MNKTSIIACTLATILYTTPGISFAIAIDTKDAGRNTYNYDLSLWSIPTNVGGIAWFDDHGLYKLNTLDVTGTARVTLTINGTPVGTASDGSTVYATNNPGIGIAYNLNYSTPTITTPQNDNVAPYEFVFNNGYYASGYLHVKYTIVRLTDQMPPGQITTAPVVTVNYFNEPARTDYPDISFTALSGTVTKQPVITACSINAPTEVKLPTLYGNNLSNGAQGVTDVPTITLTNCPGARNGISYNLSPVYSTHQASNGVLQTVTGEGYAKNVYIQVQNDDGTAHILNGNIPLSDYIGSGNYTIPKFKVAYYIDDVNDVTAGNVKSAIEVKLAYN
ncbi:fimbrial protein [Salmonella enterica]|nr:fimbrial protein [Salmonella enterica]EDJ9061595.1 fimbrial protein [Salmonella enterica subsp. arizonae]HCM1854443.1 fimbrial protein [Salmonella enterica subsp. arizonae serovar 56:z4,z23:-]EAX9061536.1 fimbrial protein [Salmonella enterica]EAZ5755147.1 fimbrial protein [Salmonella enterica]